MNIRTFWILTLRVIGVWILLQGVLALPALIPMLFIPIGVREYLLPMFIVGFYVWLVQILIFKAEWLVDLLRLDKGFKEERIETTIRHSSVLQIAVIVVGGLNLVHVLPALVKDIYLMFAESAQFGESFSNAQIIASIAQVVISYLLLAKSRLVVNLFNKDQEKPESST